MKINAVTVQNPMHQSPKKKTSRVISTPSLQFLKMIIQKQTQMIELLTCTSAPLSDCEVEFTGKPVRSTPQIDQLHYNSTTTKINQKTKKAYPHTDRSARTEAKKAALGFRIEPLPT